MSRNRSVLMVEIDLDPVPGWGTKPEDHQLYLQRLLDQNIGHYHPTVTVVATSSR